MRPGQVERTLEAEDTLAATHQAQARLAGREHDPLQARQVAPGDRLGRQDAPVAMGEALIPAPREVGAGQHQARQDQRVAQTSADARPRVLRPRTR